jgi:hypothetical protein
VLRIMEYRRKRHCVSRATKDGVSRATRNFTGGMKIISTLVLTAQVLRDGLGLVKIRTPKYSKNYTRKLRENVNQILYPNLDSEFDIQAKLCNALKCSGWDVRGEVNGYATDDWDGKPHKTRLDLVVFDNARHAVAIIECKNRIRSNANGQLRGRQGRRYPSYNLPILVCDCAHKIKETVKAVNELASQNHIANLFINA